MGEKASKGENLVSEFRPTRAAKQRPPAVYAHWHAITVKMAFTTVLEPFFEFFFVKKRKQTFASQ